MTLSQNQNQIPCYYLRAPNETVPPPQGDVLVLAGGGEHFFVGVHRKSHQQLAVTEHDLEQGISQKWFLSALQLWNEQGSRQRDVW